MNCVRARFLLYAYLDRELSRCEAEALERHLSHCGSCAARAESARGLARVLRSRLDRTPVPLRLRERLREGISMTARPRYAAFAFAATFLLLLLLPLASDVSGRRSGASSLAMTAAAAAPAASLALAANGSTGLALVSKKLSGTFVCLRCESREEAGLCPVPEAAHDAGFCADNGEVWRLMNVHPRFGQNSLGRTATVEGIAFPQSGFLRANRVGY